MHLVTFSEMFHGTAQRKKQRACAKEEERKFNATEKEDGDRQKKIKSGGRQVSTTRREMAAASLQTQIIGLFGVCGT